MGYKVKYYTVSRLLDELKLARIEGHELKFFEKIERLDLIIIDDFGGDFGAKAPRKPMIISE